MDRRQIRPWSKNVANGEHGGINIQIDSYVWDKGNAPNWGFLNIQYFFHMIRKLGPVDESMIFFNQNSTGLLKN